VILQLSKFATKRHIPFLSHIQFVCNGRPH